MQRWPKTDYQNGVQNDPDAKHSSTLATSPPGHVFAGQRPVGDAHRHARVCMVRLPSVLRCWAAHTHFHPMSNPAPISALFDDHVAKRRRQRSSHLGPLPQPAFLSAADVDGARCSPTPAPLSLSLDVFSSRTPRLSSSRHALRLPSALHAPRPRKTGRLTAASPLAPCAGPQWAACSSTETGRDA